MCAAERMRRAHSEALCERMRRAHSERFVGMEALAFSSLQDLYVSRAWRWFRRNRLSEAVPRVIKRML